MANVNHNLWPTIDMETRTPRELLEEQAEALSTRTQGLLLGRVEVAQHEHKTVIDFVIEAPRLRYRHVLFKVEHNTELAFPAVIISSEVATTQREEVDAFGRSGDRLVEEEVVTEAGASLSGFPARPPTTTRIKTFKKRVVYPNAHSQEEFIAYLRTILAAPSTQAVVNSLIARIRQTPTGAANEDLMAPDET